MAGLVTDTEFFKERMKWESVKNTARTMLSRLDRLQAYADLIPDLFSESSEAGRDRREQVLHAIREGDTDLLKEYISLFADVYQRQLAEKRNQQ